MTMRLLKLSLINLAFYTLDMGTAIAGFYFGFGLTVANWPALLGFMILARWLIYVGRGTYALSQKGKAP